MPSKRNPVVYLEDILMSIERIRDYVGGLSYGTFENLWEKQDAVLRRLAIISEAVDRLRATEAITEANIDWAAIHNLGNILRHEYDNVDLPAIWKIVHEDLPMLKTIVEQMAHKHRSPVQPS